MRTVHGVKVVVMSSDERKEHKEAINERIRDKWSASTLDAIKQREMSFSELRALGL